MQAAWQRRDLIELAQLAHWLKGAAGTVGFGSFTEPAKRLEQFAKDGRVDEIEPAIKEVLELAGRVDLPSNEPAPMACSSTENRLSSLINANITGCHYGRCNATSNRNSSDSLYLWWATRSALAQLPAATDATMSAESESGART